VRERCEPLGLERMGFVAARDFPVKANWKVYVDNFLEGYHIPLVHPALNREIDYREYLVELGPRHTLQHAPVREGSELYQGKAGDGLAYYYWLFPNLMLNIYEGQLQSNVVIPIDADNTVVRFEWFALEPLPDPQSSERWSELVRFSEVVQAEDAQICEAVQFNLHSRAYRSGPYSPKRENGVRLFHTLMQHS